MSYQKDREQTLSQLGQAGISYHDGCTLLRRATRLQRSAEASCCFPMNERQERRLEERDARDEKIITALANKYGFVADFQGDPRGCPFKLVKMLDNGCRCEIYVPGRGYPASVFA